MKRIIATMLALALVGCGQKNPASLKEDTAASTPSSTNQASAVSGPQAQLAPYVLRPLGTTGSDWRIVAVTGSRPSRQVDMLDFKSLVVTGDVRQIWMADVRETKRGISYTLMLYEYDCNKRTSRSLKYGATNGRDTILDTGDLDGKIVNVIPGTMNSAYLQYTCEDQLVKNNIPNGQDPILYIKDQFAIITKRELSELLSEFMMRKEKPLLGSQGVNVLQTYEKIAASEKDKKIIDTPLERYGLGNQIKENINSKEIQQELIERLNAVYQ